MLKSQNRLHGRREPRIVMKHGKSARSGDFMIKYLDRGQGGYRLSVTVSRKVSKKAVVRNRIRRRVYEQIRTNFDLRDKTSSVISVFSAEAATMPAEEMRHQLKQLLEKTTLLKAPQ